MTTYTAVDFLIIITRKPKQENLFYFGAVFVPVYQCVELVAYLLRLLKVFYDVGEDFCICGTKGIGVGGRFSSSCGGLGHGACKSAVPHAESVAVSKTYPVIRNIVYLPFQGSVYNSLFRLLVLKLSGYFSCIVVICTL